MTFSLEYLEAFSAAAETGSFSAAARKLGKAQSRISTAISNLEIDLGVTLFDRSMKYPVITMEGKRLLELARDIINRCKDLSENADILAGGEEPLLNLAVDELIPPKLLAETLKRFGVAFPETDLDIFTGVMEDVGKMVRSDLAHAGIELPLEAPTERCNWRLLGHMKFVIVASSSHPIAKMKRITPEDLAPYRQLVAVSRGLHRESEPIQLGGRCWKCESSQVIRDLMLQGQGWGVIAHYQVADDIAAGRLKKLPIIFEKMLTISNIYLVWKKGKQLSRISEWLGDDLANGLKNTAFF